MVGWQAMEMVNCGRMVNCAMEMVNYGRMAGYGDG